MVSQHPPGSEDGNVALADDAKLEALGDSLTYTATCSECAEVFQRSRRATRYGYALLCRTCEIDSA